MVYHDVAFVQFEQCLHFEEPHCLWPCGPLPAFLSLRDLSTRPKLEIHCCNLMKVSVNRYAMYTSPSCSYRSRRVELPAICLDTNQPSLLSMLIRLGNRGLDRLSSRLSLTVFLEFSMLKLSCDSSLENANISLLCGAHKNTKTGSSL